ncbi:MAG: hypothetical protein VYA34_11180 [Myxococcota bacterium]|nr:hypothetical protein [Myxococcota bacterium]
MRTTPLTLAIVLSMSTSALALSARDTADVATKHSWSVGLFNPMSFSWSNDIELQVHPVFFFMSPHLQTKISHVTGEDSAWRVSSIWGLSFPYPALIKAPPLGLKGYFIPTCKVAEAEPERDKWCQSPGWIAVPKVGFMASKGTTNVVTLQIDLAVGTLLAGERPAPLDTYPMLDLQLSPIFNLWRAHGSIRYDYEAFNWLRTSVETHIYRVGYDTNTERDPWTLAVHGGVDIAVGESSRLTLGVYYWNSDQRQIAIVENSEGFARVERIRSHDFLPTIDFIWNGTL